MSTKIRFEKSQDVYQQQHPIETPQIIQEKLQEFDALVNERTATTTEDNECLIQAQSRCPELLTDSFKLMFLRCQVFDVELAFGVYQRYWRKRVQIFGPERAFLPITLDTFTAEELTALEQGYITLLPNATDPKGRAILYIDPSKLDLTKFSRLSLCRAVWYLQHAALESESVQKYGQIYFIDVSRSGYAHFDRKLCKLLIPSLVGTLPSRTAGFHICRPTTIVSVALPVVKMFLSERLKNKFLFHTNDVVKRLKKFELDASVIPVAMGGDLEHNPRSWLEARQLQGL